MNFKERDTDYSFPNWRHNDSKVFESEINRIMNSSNLDYIDYAKQYLIELKHKLYLAEKFDTVSQMRPTNPIYIETSRKTSLKFIFNTWDEIHKAHYILRNEYSRKKWNLNFEEVIYNNDRDDLLNIMYPNLIVYSFNHYREEPEIAPPPPVISEIEVVERE